MYRDLLRMRREERAYLQRTRERIDGAVLGAEAFVLHFGAADAPDERLLVVNLGADVVSPSFAEPLIAPPAAMRYALHWSSEDPRYGGAGTPDVVTPDGWRIPGHAAVVLKPEFCDERDRSQRR
jgi:maltooligosyltrehalose trehalohydrolase